MSAVAGVRVAPEMVSRVALATCDCMPCICKNKSGFEGMPCLDRGRRAIAAMREPTDAMIEAGYIRLAGEKFQRPREPVNAWPAMIDEAQK